MGFQATVLKIFIASPGDTSEERNQVERIIHQWNDLNSEREKVILLPIRWEESISPEYSLTEDGQELINKRILIDSDIVIMIFKAKLGSPTGRADSGTLEELEVFSKHNAERIGIFFCNIPAPIDSQGIMEYQKVVSFREKLKEEPRGLYGTYEPKIVENYLTRQVAKYTTKLEIEHENQKSQNIEEDKTSIIIENIKNETLRPDELLLLYFMYTKGYHSLLIAPQFMYNIYDPFLKQNGYKDEYIDLLELTCERLVNRRILDFSGVKEAYNMYSNDIEEFHQYKLNISTYNGLGKILKNFKTYIAEMLSMCEIVSIEDDSLPF